MNVAPLQRLDAELYDTLQAHRLKTTKRPCIYCGAMTTSVFQVCTAHSDLPALDDQAQGPRWPS